jgi:hypothetical protein
MDRLPIDVIVHQVRRYLKLSEVTLLFSTSISLFSGATYNTLHFLVHIGDIDTPCFGILRNKISSGEQLCFDGGFSLLKGMRERPSDRGM